MPFLDNKRQSESKTPETDALESTDAIFSDARHFYTEKYIKLARQLELSRDEWRTLAEEVIDCFPEDEFEREPLKGFLTRFRELQKREHNG